MKKELMAVWININDITDWDRWFKSVAVPLCSETFNELSEKSLEKLCSGSNSHSECEYLRISVQKSDELSLFYKRSNNLHNKGKYIFQWGILKYDT